MNDIEIIYERLKDKYNLVLTNSLALDDGYTWNVPIIVGESGSRRFHLYADKDTLEPFGVEFVFSVEYEKCGEPSEKCHTHGHPQDIEDAIDFVERFMAGEMKIN